MAKAHLNSVFDPAVAHALAGARDLAMASTKQESASAIRPFPSPADWRDRWLYMVFLDRFNNPVRPINSASGGVGWNQVYGKRQGGTFAGVMAKLPYLRDLGVGAVWLTPVVKNPKPDWDYNYTGYGVQDLLAIDERFASDGTAETAERELAELVEEAHRLNLHVILDIVLNHTARVFDYVRDGSTITDFVDDRLLRSPPLAGCEPQIEWLNGLGCPQPDWQGPLPPPAVLSPDDAVQPAADFRTEYFRRRGSKTSDRPDWGNGLAPGDFGWMRQLAAEYRVGPEDPHYQRRFGSRPVLTILARAYCHLIARYDFDGFRIDTVKYVDPDIVEAFGNAVREYALSIGKRNFFTFGEVYDDEATIARFVGRHGSDGVGIDAALDFPLFFTLPDVVKGLAGVEGIRAIYDERTVNWKQMLSSHGEASRYFVTFLDNHDQARRIRDVGTTEEQVEMALAVLFTLIGIPCVYYGTEQGLSGTVDASGNRVYAQYEGVREALWGKGFDPGHPTYRAIQRLSELRAAEPALRYGRQYFRPVSGNGLDFGLPKGNGGVLAYSRVLGDSEIVIVANTSGNAHWSGSVLVDREINEIGVSFAPRFRNLPAPPATTTVSYVNASFWNDGQLTGTGPAAFLNVDLRPSELLILERAL